MRTKMRRVACPLSALLAGAMLLLACGSDGATTTTTPAETTTSTKATTTTTVDHDTVITAEGTAATTAGGDSSGVVSDPCALLTAEDIAGALDIDPGQVPAGTTDDFNGVFPGCDWGEYVKVYIGLSDAWLNTEHSDPLDGLGDRAFYDSQWHRVAVQADDERFFVVLGLLATGDDLTMLTPLARAVIANLPT